MKNKSSLNVFKLSVLSLSVAAVVAQAQTTPAPAEEIVVTGYKASLQSATNAKRASTAMVESVFAEDIGKFADTNIAEAVNRMPGIQISRDTFGDGVNVSIRGLGSSFTKVTLNDSQIAVASAGSVDAQNQNREIDLNLFPTELFTRFDVKKTPVASMLEGGVAGVVNIRNARPFDNKEQGFQSVFNVQGIYTEINEKTSPKLSALGSWTNDTFGVLGGVSLYNRNLTTKGYETIGYTTLSVPHGICGSTPTGSQTLATAGTCNAPSTGNDWNVAGVTATQGYGVVPTNAGAGLTAGTVIDKAFLLGKNPGLTIDQVANGFIPRLGRPSYMDGDQDRLTGVVSLEYRPSDQARFYLDVVATDQQKEFNRIDLNFIGRFGNAIPLNMKVDENNVVTSATFANAQFFLEARPYSEDLNFYNVNPGAHFEFNDLSTVDVQLNSSRSDWRRESPTVLINTPLNKGISVDYVNNGNVPTFTPKGVNLNDPAAGWTWAGGRLNIQNEERDTETDGIHVDYRFGDDTNNVKVGIAKDTIKRAIRGYDNSARWEDVACRNGLDASGNSPATGRAACDGMSANAKIPQSALASYLMAGPYGFIDVNYDKFFAATNYYALKDSAPEGNSSNTGANSGIIDEDTTGGYFELNTSTEVGGRPLNINVGARYAETEQLISGPVTIAGVRQYQDLKSKYDAWLPSFNSTFDVTDDIKLRFAASRTLTRPNPSSMLPATTFSDVSAVQARQGNPNLSPYLGTNFDIGGEWYTGDEGYVGVTLFEKQITGFTVTGTNQIPFLNLGIPFDSLTQQQRDAINSPARGGPNVATVTVEQQVNASGSLNIEGAEITWVQPLDMILEGLGFNANYTHIKQKSEGSGVPAIAVGVSPETYNFTAYWENYGASIRLTYSYNEGSYASGNNQNNTLAAYLYSDSRGQLDLSSSYKFEGVTGEPELSLNVSNLTGEPLRTTWGYDSATFTYYDPGMIVTLGLRASF
ncbi:TonB-dependent receptor [Cellvibrio zantedeschiae]|uniref:TonB-dependent receptor n=1 Tax=Cellvibrio zantedeschiae TaxID=1237077 RepID=A0ABQ3AS01_9GAMM|nr:TonB-dependent receptor [Cellvibrio zantedeschiae]GGY64952.1 TonB-dependent receptor [Cellvibrio zantedeschiae]